MSILLFIFMLVALVVGHEAGHFVAARLSGMRVPEFGIGFPPRLWGKKIGKTEYTINAIPLGGFVKIYGEDATTAGEEADAFSNRPKYAQAATLVAGPFMNLLIAFLLTSLAFMVGVPAATDGAYRAQDIHDAHVLVTQVLPGSPAEKAGIKTGDTIVGVSINATETKISNPEQISTLVQTAHGAVAVSLVRGDKDISIAVSPIKGVVSEAPEKLAIGIATNSVGTLHLSFFPAVAAGFHETLKNMYGVARGVISLVGHVFTFSADLSSVAGPVGIASLVGDAASFGLGSILLFAALISVNLGVINLFPFPALDGGRLAILLVETVSKRKVPANFSNALNTIGFFFLLALLVAITGHDISNLFK